MEGRPQKNHLSGGGARTTASSSTDSSNSSNRSSRAPHSPTATPLGGVTWGLQQHQHQHQHPVETAAGELLPLEPQISASSSFSDGAFECESPAVVMASQRSQQHEVGAPTAVAFDFHHQQQQNYQQQQSLASQSINSEDLLEDGEVAFGELTQPRPEIVLRWKRFAILVLVAVVFISGATAMLVHGIEMTTVDASKAEEKVNYLNSFFGIAMGFFESILGLLLGNLFPVFIVYLHNLKWFPGDNPAEKSSKFKKIALMLFIPAIMVALGNSFSAVQANQRTSKDGEPRMRSRHLMQQESSIDSATYATSHWSLLTEGADVKTVMLPLEETILSSAVTRRVFPVPPASASSCSLDSKDMKTEVDQLGGILQALPTAAFGFPLKSWNKQMYPDPASWSKTKTATFRPASTSKTLPSGEVSDVFALPSIAFELLAQGLKQANTLKTAGKEAKLNNLSLQEYLGGPKVANASNLLLEITRGFQKLGLGALDFESLSVTLQQSPLSPLIQVKTMTVEIPIAASSNSSLKSKVVCGSQSCVLLDAEADMFQLPRKQISMAQYCKGAQDATDDPMGACRSEKNAAFLFGFTSTASVSPTSSSTAPKRSLVFSFGKLSWTFDDFSHTCDPSDPTAAAATNDCHVLHHKLTPSSQHLVLGAKFLPEALLASGRSGPIRLVQLAERKAAIASSSRALTIEYLVDGKQVLESSGSNVCSPAVDLYQQYVAKNHLYLDQHLVQPMYTAALLYLFQNAVLVDEAADTAELAISRQRQRRALSAQATGDKYIEIYLSNTKVGQVSTWLGCGVILILSVLVMALPNERARLEPPRGGNARAERFIAVQTEEAYPNFIYKKRFLIGKTGEEIKFGEFAVESVGLHHKMEEDEQIYL